MEAFFRYLKRNVFLAFKSVFFHYKQYLCFFIALLLIQMFYGIITFAADNNNEIEYKRVVEEYDYHIVLKDLNSDQYLLMQNDHLTTVFKKDHIHDIARVYERDDPGTYNRKYDMYIKFRGDVQTSYKIFQERYYEQLAALNTEGLRISTTPLLTFEQNELANTISYVIYSLMITAVSVFFLMELYNIRLNHYKFTYGIYMSFGANFNKLLENSFWEMMVVALMTFIPSVGISALVDWLIYLTHSVEFTFHWLGVLKVFIFSMIIAAASVVLPVWTLSRKMPMKLIIAEDNSNLVISPRRSFEFYHIKFPSKYERYSLWRFRKHYASLVITAVLFTTLFMCVLFFANIYKTELNYEQPQFRLDFLNDDYYYDEIMREELYAVKGVTNIEKSLVTKANELRSHVLFDKNDALPFSSFVIPASDDSKRATNFVQFSPCDEEIVKYLGRYDYEGDMSAILTDDKMIIVSDSYDNTRKFGFKPGDKIELATYVSRVRAAPEYASGNELLQAELQYYKFEYTEFTICAVLKNNPTFGNTPIYMSDASYTEFTKKPVNYDKVSLFVDDSLSIAEVSALENELRDWSDYYGNIDINNLHTLSLNRIERDKNYYPSYVAVGILILFISPLIWFFTQILFYMKRENEFNILTAFGGIITEVKKIYLTDGWFVGIAGVIVSLLLNFVGVFGIYKFFNVVVPKFSGTSIRLDFTMPILPLIVGVLMSIVGGVLSAYLPYKTYEKKFKKRTAASHEFGDDE